MRKTRVRSLRDDLGDEPEIKFLRHFFSILRVDPPPSPAPLSGETFDQQILPQIALPPVCPRRRNCVDDTASAHPTPSRNTNYIPQTTPLDLKGGPEWAFQSMKRSFRTPPSPKRQISPKSCAQVVRFCISEKSLIFRDEFFVIFYAAVFQFRAFFDRKYCRFEPISLQSRPGVFFDFFQHAGKNAGFL